MIARRRLVMWRSLSPTVVLACRMLSAGFETTDPRTQTRTVLVKAAAETGGRGWVLEVHCPQGAPVTSPEHIHKTWVETFEILEGTSVYVLAGEERPLRKGES